MKIRICFICCILFVLLNSCTSESDIPDNKVTSVSLYQNSLCIVKGAREKMLPVIVGGDSLTKCIWSIEDTSIAKIEDNGVVNAISVGTTKIKLSVGSLSAACDLSVVESPITNLGLPEANSTIAQGSLILIQGAGFTSETKVWFRPNNVQTKKSSSVLRSFKVQQNLNDSYSDILASINDQASTFISFYANVNPGYYSIMIEQNKQLYNLGNIKVATVKLPAFPYDKNKTIWDDTHWRRFQLRGHVKEIITKEEYIPYWRSYGKIHFNRNGYIDTTNFSYNEKLKVWTNNYCAIYQYDNKNRVIKKTETTRVSSITRIIIDYTYGNHPYYIPLDLDNFFVFFQPTSYWLNFGWGGTFLRDRYILDMFQKGVTEIKAQCANDTSTYIYDYKVDASSSNVVIKMKVPAKTGEYFWDRVINLKYSGEFPVYLASRNYVPGTKDSFYSWRDVDSTVFSFTSEGFPISSTRYDLPGKEQVESYMYVRNSPFLLYETGKLNGPGEFNISYDVNGDVLTGHTEDEDVNFNYTSYDDYGNWTECVVVSKSNLGRVSYTKLCREIKYW